MQLKPIQAFTLREAEQTGGVLGALPVGAGKSLTSFLLPLALGVKKAVLLVPPELREKIFQLEYPFLMKHWILPTLEDGFYIADTDCVLSVVKYSTVQHPKTAQVLNTKQPKAIIADEGHRLKYRTSATTKRVVNYLRANPDTKFVALSGSIANRSITEFAGISELALGEGSPLPTDWMTLQAWSQVLDKGGRPDMAGALSQLQQKGETVIEAYSRRMAETPGVVLTSDNSIPSSLNLISRDVKVDKPTASALAQVRGDWETPDGFQFDSILEFSRYARQLACGFWYKRIWPRNEPLELREEWLRCRNEWNSAVRDFLGSVGAKVGMDSPFFLKTAAAKGTWKCPAYAPWAEIADKCEPDTEAIWFSDYLVQDAIKWGKENVGIIWYTHAAVGHRIAKEGGFPLYSSRNDAAALQVESGKRTVVVSQNAHNKGKNLQMFSSALVTTPSSNGQVWEQTLGRLHREGQEADEVNYHVYVHTPELNAAVHSAIEDCKFGKGLLRSNQKLLSATLNFKTQPLPRRK